MNVATHPDHPGIVIITADGSLNTETAVDVAARMDQIVESGARRVVLDCSHLGYVSSYGLGMVVMLYSKLAKAGGELKLAAVKEPIMRVLGMTRVDRIFDIQPDVASAVTAFRP